VVEKKKKIPGPNGPEVEVSSYSANMEDILEWGPYLRTALQD
jgi:hypothetical protein